MSKRGTPGSFFNLDVTDNNPPQPIDKAKLQEAKDVIESFGKNKELGLPFGKMQTIKIAFDVDGTLRCNCTETCQDPNDRIAHLFSILSHFKNTELYVWSGGGADYAWRFADKLKLPVSKARCISKIGAPQMDIAIDDIQDTAIGKINLIVREK